MKIQKPSLTYLIANLAVFAAVVAFVIVPMWKWPARPSLPAWSDLFPPTGSVEVNAWLPAIQKVKEDRGEPMGRQAQVETPAELRHYRDTRRFLAIQVAEVNEHKVGTPQDFVDLAAMIDRGELAQLQPIGDDYILFGVGGNADKDLFTRFENGKGVNLYNEAGLRQEYARLTESQAQLNGDITSLKRELAGLKRRERSQRARLQKEIAELEKRLKVEREDKALLDRYYAGEKSRQQLFADYQSLEKVGSKLAGNVFDIADAAARQRMKVRLLSSLRPEAFKVMEEIARSYRQKFDRRLPITSLVRPDEYQLELSKTNPNATRIETPPHSTGLAFDVLYRYMTAAEQAHVMSELARLKDEGRIEVLRENRDHYHVFAFVDGARPREEFIAAALGEFRPARNTHAPTRTRNAHHAVKKTAKSKLKNNAVKREVKRAKRRR